MQHNKHFKMKVFLELPFTLEFHAEDHLAQYHEQYHVKLLLNTFYLIGHMLRVSSTDVTVTTF